MAGSAAIITNGTTLRVGNGATPEVFTAVAEVVDVDQPSAQAAEVDVTHLLSPAKEFKAGLRDFGSANLTINIVLGNTQQQQLEDDGATGVTRNYRIVYPDAVNGVQFAAFVKGFKREQAKIDLPLRAVVTLRATGAVTRL
jgi:hypothetical protein